MILLLFIAYLEKVQLLHRNDPKSPQLASVKPSVLRSLFTVGLFCKHFDMDTISSETKVHITCMDMYALLSYSVSVVGPNTCSNGVNDCLYLLIYHYFL